MVFPVSRDTRHNPAQRRYLWRFMPAMLAYMAILFACTALIRDSRPQGALLAALSVLPAVPLVAVIGIMGAYLLEERDEFIRNRLVTAMIGGLGVTLAITTVWGFLENGGAVSHFPTFLTFPLWCGSFGLCQCITKLVERRAA